MEKQIFHEEVVFENEMIPRDKTFKQLIGSFSCFIFGCKEHPRRTYHKYNYYDYVCKRCNKLMGPSLKIKKETHPEPPKTQIIKQ